MFVKNVGAVKQSEKENQMNKTATATKNEWNRDNRNQGNLVHRKTIQNQQAEIATLRNKSDALLGQVADKDQRILELENQLEFKSILLSAAMADLQRMDKKLECEKLENYIVEQQLLDAQDEFFDLGDLCMGEAGLL